MSAKNIAKQTAQNDNETVETEGKVPVVETPTFSFNDTLASAERDVEAAFSALLVFLASQATAETQNNIVHRLADVLTSEGKAPTVAYDPSGSALNKRLKRLFGNKGVLTICNMARVIVGYAPILG